MTLLAELRAAVGPAHVLHDGDLSAYEVDWRKRYRGRALAVVRPGERRRGGGGGAGLRAAWRGRRAAGRQHRAGRRRRCPMQAAPRCC